MRLKRASCIEWPGTGMKRKRWQGELSASRCLGVTYERGEDRNRDGGIVRRKRGDGGGVESYREEV